MDQGSGNQDIQKSGNQDIHDSLKRAWDARLQKGDHYRGVIRVNLEKRTVDFAPRDRRFSWEQSEPGSFTDVDEQILKQIVRSAGPGRGNIIEMPITRLDQSDTGRLEGLGIPVQDLSLNNLPSFQTALEDLSLDAQLTWTAASMALSTMEKIQEQHGPPALMSGYGPMLQEIQTETRGIIKDVEAGTPPAELHQNHSYTIALRTQAVLELLESRFEHSVYTQREMTIDNINTLRAVCLKRKEFLASREGDEGALREIQASLREAREQMEMSSRRVRQSSFITALTQA